MLLDESYSAPAPCHIKAAIGQFCYFWFALSGLASQLSANANDVKCHVTWRHRSCSAPAPCHIKALDSFVMFHPCIQKMLNFFVALPFQGVDWARCKDGKGGCLWMWCFIILTSLRVSLADSNTLAFFLWDELCHRKHGKVTQHQPVLEVKVWKRKKLHVEKLREGKMQ